jgi:hypothetical protein
MVPLRNLNCINSNQVHGPLATPAATGPKIRPFCLIFLYKMFFFPSFHVPNNASCRVTSASIPRTIVSSIHRMALSFSWVAYAAAVSHQLCHFKQDDWWGGAFILYGLPSVVCPRQCGTQALQTGAPSTAARWGRTILWNR